MTLNNLLNFLRATGIPVAFRVFESEEPDFPYLVVVATGASSDGSDYKAELIRRTYNIELYTLEKDPSTEMVVEDCLEDMGLKWDTTETYIDDQALYQVVYSIEFYELR